MHPPATLRITFTFAHHAVASFEGTWRLENLRAHPKDAKIYSDLKIALAKRFRENPAYNTAKGEFVEELTSRAIRYSEK